MASTLTRADVERVAALARLELTSAEIDLFTPQLATILGYAAEIQTIDTTGVAPMSHASSVDPGWRADEPQPSLDRGEILRGAPDANRDAGVFRVPNVL